MNHGYGTDGHQAADRDFEDSTFFKTVLEHLNDAVVVGRMAVGTEAARILYVNPAFTRDLGYTIEEAGGKSVDFFFEIGPENPGLRRVGERLLRGEAVVFDITARHRDGRRLRQRLQMNPVLTESALYSITTVRTIEEDDKLEGALTDLRRQVTKLTTELRNTPGRLESLERKLSARMAHREQLRESPAKANGNDVAVGSVLIVDPDEASRDGLRLALAGSGLDVIEAESGSEALRLSLELRPQAVVLEFDLGDMDAREAMEWIHRARPQTVVYLFSDDRQAVSLLSIGAARVFTRAELSELVEQLGNV